jgi:hypothetical protein
MVTPPSPFKQSTWYKQRKKFGFSLDRDFVRDLIAYEYVLFKPTELWQDIGIHLDQMDFRAIIRECGRMRKAIEDEGIETDVTDEQFLMQIAAGYSDKNKEFKQQNLLDIISGDYRWFEQIGQQINAYSKYLAHSTTNRFKQT